ncbi:hypothetical protein [Burkholderia ubonensis]|uniref:hypothetical protein n=1 Tax=Burkholderia ubonensis TaxID=101571 RepID=UPI0012FB1319|nr:hypothetical protein [Burkholderia ubonensis]
MSKSFEIVHPAENEILAPGALRIRGSGPVEHQVHVCLKKAGKIVTDGEWTVTIDADGEWRASYPFVITGEDWSVHATLITNIPIAPETRVVNFKVL